MEYLAIIVITFISGVIGTGLGGLVGALLRRESNKVVSLLLSFAGGIMLAVVCFDLMSQPIEMMNFGRFAQIYSAYSGRRCNCWICVSIFVEFYYR